jgi:hypothetical protein
MDGPPRFMEFVYTALFVRTGAGWLNESTLLELERTLVANPRAGAAVPGLPGLRKLRIRLLGRGKRGGGRVFYVYDVAASRVYLLTALAKSRKEDLRPEEVRTCGD